MKRRSAQTGYKGQAGQALAEFNVAAVFVLVPVFLVIPLVAKYIDVRHTAVQSARYTAWERTVWFEPSTTPKASDAPFRSQAQIERAADARILGMGGRPVTQNDWGRDITDGELNPYWKDPAANPLVSVAANSAMADQLNEQEVPSRAYVVFDGLQRLEDMVNEGTNYVANIFGVTAPRMDLVGKYHFEGFYRTETRIPVNNVPRVASFGQGGGVFENLNLVMQGQAALIADGWAASDRSQFAAWTDDYVPTRALRAGFEPIQRVISIMHPEVSPGNLEMGYIDTNAVPTSDIAPECPNGICNY